MNGVGGVGDKPAGLDVLAKQVQETAKASASKDAEIARLKAMIKGDAEDSKTKLEPSEKPKRGTATVSSASTKARYAIILEEARDQSDNPVVDVGVNGRVYRMNRGVVCEVPPEVIGVLKNAVIGHGSSNVDETGLDKGVRYRSSRRFPYRVLGKAIDENGVRIETFENETPEYE